MSSEDPNDEQVQPARTANLLTARRAASIRYAEIAELLKREVGVRRHYPQKSISGVAWPGLSIIVAPEGISVAQGVRCDAVQSLWTTLTQKRLVP